jgi:hypothetical protein
VAFFRRSTAYVVDYAQIRVLCLLRPAFVGVVKAVELPPQHRASEERSFQARPVTPIFDGLQNDCLVCCRPLSNTNLVTVRNALFSSRYWATQTQSDTKTLRCFDRPTYASFTSCFSELVAAPVRDREKSRLLPPLCRSDITILKSLFVLISLPRSPTFKPAIMSLSTETPSKENI